MRKQTGLTILVLAVGLIALPGKAKTSNAVSGKESIPKQIAQSHIQDPSKRDVERRLDDCRLKSKTVFVTTELVVHISMNWKPRVIGT